MLVCGVQYVYSMSMSTFVATADISVPYYLHKRTAA